MVTRNSSHLRRGGEVPRTTQTLGRCGAATRGADGAAAAPSPDRCPRLRKGSATPPPAHRLVDKSRLYQRKRAFSAPVIRNGFRAAACRRSGWGRLGAVPTRPGSVQLGLELDLHDAVALLLELPVH